MQQCVENERVQERASLSAPCSPCSRSRRIQRAPLTRPGPSPFLDYSKFPMAMPIELVVQAATASSAPAAMTSQVQPCTPVPMAIVAPAAKASAPAPASAAPAPASAFQAVPPAAGLAQHPQAACMQQPHAPCQDTMSRHTQRCSTTTTSTGAATAVAKPAPADEWTQFELLSLPWMQQQSKRQVQGHCPLPSTHTLFTCANAMFCISVW